MRGHVSSRLVSKLSSRRTSRGSRLHPASVLRENLPEVGKVDCRDAMLALWVIFAATDPQIGTAAWGAKLNDEASLFQQFAAFHIGSFHVFTPLPFVSGGAPLPIRL